jgi:transposase
MVHEQVFVFVLKLAENKGLLPGKTAGVDSTLLEANASMKTIVRRDSGDEWKDYLRKLAVAAGLDNPNPSPPVLRGRGEKYHTTLATCLVAFGCRTNSR